MSGCMAWAERRRTPEIFDVVSPFTAFLSPWCKRPHGSRLEQRVDLRRTHDGPVTHEDLVVVLDAVMVVEIVDHDAEGFLHAAWRVVAEPIDPFEPCAIAEVKTRHGVDAYRGLPREIAGAKPQQGRAQLLALRRVIPPAAALELWQQRGIGIASIGKPLTEPAPKPRYRRQGRKTLQLRKLRLELLDHLLDQEIAERHAAQAALTVGDRIEDRRVGARGPLPRGGLIGVLRQERRHGRGQSFHQSNLDENQRLAGKCGMEEGEAAPIGCKPPPQIVPALDLMHRLIGDQLLQHRRRGLPVDPPHLEKTAVEPGGEPVEWPVPSFSPLSRCQGRCADEFHWRASHSGAKGGRTKRWSFGSAAIAARSSSSSWVPSASRLAFWLSGRAAFGITMTPS